MIKSLYGTHKNKLQKKAICFFFSPQVIYLFLNYFKTKIHYKISK